MMRTVKKSLAVLGTAMFAFIAMIAFNPMTALASGGLVGGTETTTTETTTVVASTAWPWFSWVPLLVLGFVLIALAIILFHASGKKKEREKDAAAEARMMQFGNNVAKIIDPTYEVDNSGHMFQKGAVHRQVNPNGTITFGAPSNVAMAPVATPSTGPGRTYSVTMH
ncbi:hypothetical protein FWC63_00300 [Candidatus Saccharibacteria bacterium]|nr:hypothetical protein [Candidatus Saccharibacteria bacterium]